LGKVNILITSCVSSSLSHNTVVSVNQQSLPFPLLVQIELLANIALASRELEEGRNCMMNEWPCGIKTYITGAHSGSNDRCESRQVFSGGGHKKTSISLEWNRSVWQYYCFMFYYISYSFLHKIVTFCCNFLRPCSDLKNPPSFSILSYYTLCFCVF